MMSSLYVSTKNQDKLRELAELLGDKVAIYHPGPDDPDVDETGSTLWENALLKADAGHKRSALITIADDTGLEVDALGGRPGVHSSRYAGETASYQDNRDKLLHETGDVPENQLSARFRSVICCVGAAEEPLRFDGVLEGTIIREPRGQNGFGYDPVFVPKGETRTLAEMEADEKNRISHRGRALRAFLDWWREYMAV